MREFDAFRYPSATAFSDRGFLHCYQSLFRQYTLIIYIALLALLAIGRYQRKSAFGAVGNAKRGPAQTPGGDLSG